MHVRIGLDVRRGNLTNVFHIRAFMFESMRNNNTPGTYPSSTRKEGQ